MEQLVARRAHNPKVVGSSPAPATRKVKSLESKVLRLFVWEQLVARRAHIRLKAVRQLADRVLLPLQGKSKASSRKS
jgi:hypothetical protein